MNENVDGASLYLGSTLKSGKCSLKYDTVRPCISGANSMATLLVVTFSASCRFIDIVKKIKFKSFLS